MFGFGFLMHDLVSRIVRGGFPRSLLARQRVLSLLVGTLAATALAGSLPSAAHATTTSPVASPYEWREVFSKNGSIMPVRVPAEPARGVLGPPSAVVNPPPAAVVPVQVTGPSSDRIDLVFVGDGYTSTDLASYSAQVRARWQAITSIEPLLTYRDYFNVWQVNIVSAESGVDNDPTLGVERDTALDMRFWCNGLDRLLCVDTNKALAYAANAPEAEMVIALANSTAYGGAGYVGTLATLSGNNPAAAQIAIHEFGHAFGGLADEYDYYYYGGETNTYPGGEPSHPNVSSYTAPTLLTQQLKWYRWIGEYSPDGSVVSSYEGAIYYRFGIYRATENSIMRSLGQEFNLPGREAMIEAIYGRVRLLRTSADGTQRLDGDDVVTLTTPEPVGNDLDVRWHVNGSEVASERGRKQFAIASLSSALPSFELSVEVVDRTPAVRDESFRAGHMHDSRTWRVLIDKTPPETMITAGPGEGTANALPSVVFSFSGTDNVTAGAALKFECRLDAAPFTVCTSPFRFTSLAEGQHTFTVQASDQAPNTDPTPAVRHWTIDLTPPSKPSIIGPRTTRTRRPTYRFQSRDSITAPGNLRFRCAVDSRRLRACPAVYRRRLAPGTHVLNAASLDEVGRLSAVAHARITVLRPR